MGILENIGKGKRGRRPKGRGELSPAMPLGSAQTAPSAGAATSSPLTQRPRTGTGVASGSRTGGKAPGRRRRKSSSASPRERLATAAAPLHDRRRRLVGARESTLRDLGGLMLEMYKRNRFREELLLDKCEEVLAIEVEIAHVDQRLFQLAPPNAAGMRPIGRCECDAPIYPGQNFCGVCGRSFTTLTQARACARCGAGLRRGDQYCSTCGTEAPDALQVIAPPLPSTRPGPFDASSIAVSAVAQTVVIDTPMVDEPAAQASNSPPAVVAAPAEPPNPAQDPPARETGFSWADGPPAPAPEAAMDAALDTLVTGPRPAPHPTDPETPFAGFPLSATIPPPPMADPVDLPIPPDVVPVRKAAAPFGDAPALPPSSVTTPNAVSPHPDKAGKHAARAEAKALAAEHKKAAKQARERAKNKAKAARDARKRGGGGA